MTQLDELIKIRQELTKLRKLTKMLVLDLLVRYQRDEKEANVKA